MLGPIVEGHRNEIYRSVAATQQVGMNYLAGPHCDVDWNNIGLIGSDFVFPWWYQEPVRVTAESILLNDDAIVPVQNDRHWVSRLAGRSRALLSHAGNHAMVRLRHRRRGARASTPHHSNCDGCRHEHQPSSGLRYSHLPSISPTRPLKALSTAPLVSYRHLHRAIGGRVGWTEPSCGNGRRASPERRLPRPSSSSTAGMQAHRPACPDRHGCSEQKARCLVTPRPAAESHLTPVPTTLSHPFGVRGQSFNLTLRFPSDRRMPRVPAHRRSECGVPKALPLRSGAPGMIR